MFPIIAKTIEELSTRNPGFATHDEIARALLDDPQARGAIEQAHHAQPDHSHEWLAHNMVAWFSQKISAERSKWADRFERNKVDGKWAYRPQPETRR